MVRRFTCIMCPQGCEITAEGEKEHASITGNRCRRGETYVRQELVNPMRNIATSVSVTGGVLPLVSVRLTNPIPKSRIFDVVEEIHRIRCTAPVYEGEILLSDVLGLGSHVIATRTVEEKKGENR